MPLQGHLSKPLSNICSPWLTFPWLLRQTLCTAQIRRNRSFYHPLCPAPIWSKKNAKWLCCDRCREIQTKGITISESRGQHGVGYPQGCICNMKSPQTANECVAEQQKARGDLYILSRTFWGKRLNKLCAPSEDPSAEFSLPVTFTLFIYPHEINVCQQSIELMVRFPAVGCLLAVESFREVSMRRQTAESETRGMSTRFIFGWRSSFSLGPWRRGREREGPK